MARGEGPLQPTRTREAGDQEGITGVIRWQRTLPGPCDATASAPRARRRRHGAMQAGSLGQTRSVAEEDVMDPPPGLLADARRVGPSVIARGTTVRCMVTDPGGTIA